jgi:hypothetical protein
MEAEHQCMTVRGVQAMGAKDRDLHDVWPPPGQPCEPCRVPLAGRHQHKVSRDPMMKGAQ